MTHLTLTPAQYQAHQAKVHGKAPKSPQERTEPKEAASGKADRWPLVLRDKIVADGLPEPYREFIFHQTRNWRLDLAWPADRLACEVDGMVHRIKGRFLRDIERHNAMMQAGWKWVRVTPRMVETGEALHLVREMLRSGYESGAD